MVTEQELIVLREDSGRLVEKVAFPLDPKRWVGIPRTDKDII
jgi:hypothetical protein